LTDTSLAQPAHEPITREELRRAIQERTTKGLLLNREAERVHRLEGNLWAVPSEQGGYYRVNLAEETCGCPDFRYLCCDPETGAVLMGCKHLFAASLARENRRRRRRSSCSACFGVYVAIAGEKDGIEREESVPCRRCNA
jgi:hypothetical protein